MTLQTFSEIITIDGQGQPAAAATVQAYEPSDTSFTTPLAAVDLNGLPLTLTSSSLYMLPDFRVDIAGLTVVIKSGDLPAREVLSLAALTTGVANAQASAAASATSSATSATVAASAQTAAEAAQSAAAAIAASSVKTVNGIGPDGSGNVTVSGGGGGGSVASVNGQVGTVVLGKGDLGLGNVDNTSDAAKPLSSAATAALALKANLAGTVRTVNGTAPDGSGNVNVAGGGGGSVETVNGVSPDGSGNVTLVKGNIGLGNVDNTPDASKPISTPVQTALDGKAADSAVVKLTGAQTISGAKTFSTTPVIPDAGLSQAKVSGLVPALAGKVAIAPGSPVTAPLLWLGPTSSLPGTKDSSTVYITYED